MKKIVQQVDNEGLESLLGEVVILFCMNYFYTGTLEGVNDSCVLLGDDAAIVYETGPFDSGRWTNAQRLGHKLYVQAASIESFGKTAKR